MTEPLAADPAVGDTSAPEVPVLTTDQIKDMVRAEAQRISDERIKGMQSASAKREAVLRNEMEALKRRLPADADSDDRSDLDAERRRLEREVSLWKAAAANPQLAPLLTSLNEAEGPEDWAEALTAWQQASAPASPPVDVGVYEPEPTPAVDPNRNIRQPQGWGPAGPTEDQSLAFLKGADWPKG